MKANALIAAAAAIICSSNANAEAVDEAYKGAAIHIVTAHECWKLTGDTDRKDLAIKLSKARLMAAGYSEEQATKTIEEVVSKLTDKTPGTTKQVCEMILSRWEKAK